MRGTERGTSSSTSPARRVEDLYNDFDKSAPYIRRDLDQDLADYLIGCARELGRVTFKILFTLSLQKPEGFRAKAPRVQP
jgi:hypothetical protein